MAGGTASIRQPEIDWEIKAASPPYDGLQELATEFGLGPLAQRPPYIEAVAYNVEAIDVQRSKVSGTSAEIHVLLAKGLPPDRLTLGYRVYVPGSATTRSVIAGSAMQWNDEEQAQRGQLQIQIPVAAALSCTVSYDGIAQSHYWLGDPDRAQNPRRAVSKPSIRNLKH